MYQTAKVPPLQDHLSKLSQKVQENEEKCELNCILCLILI